MKIHYILSCFLVLGTLSQGNSSERSDASSHSSLHEEDHRAVTEQTTSQEPMENIYELVRKDQERRKRDAQERLTILMSGTKYTRD